MPKLIFINEYAEEGLCKMEKDMLYKPPLMFIISKRDGDYTLVLACEITDCDYKIARKLGFSDKEVIGGGEAWFHLGGEPKAIRKIVFRGVSAKYGRAFNTKEVIKSLTDEIISECKKFIPTVEEVMMID